jgi:hypothetical protein
MDCPLEVIAKLPLNDMSEHNRASFIIKYINLISHTWCQSNPGERSVATLQSGRDVIRTLSTLSVIFWLLFRPLDLCLIILPSWKTLPRD